MSNKEDLQAINGYVTTRSAPAAGAPADVIKKWQAHVAQWNRWYPGVIGSWYVSDADLANGKAIRDALMKNQNPDAWQWVKESSDPKKAWADKPNAPVAGKKPWEQKGLTYSDKLKSKADVVALQKRINAAGYKPALKVDGKYGKGTQAGERWLSLQQKQPEPVKPPTDPAVLAAALLAPPPVMKKAAVSAPKKVAAKPTPKVEAKVAAVVAPNILGIPLNIKSALTTAAGTAAGWVAGGPVGAAIGVPVGFVASRLFPEKK